MYMQGRAIVGESARDQSFRGTNTVRSQHKKIVKHQEPGWGELMCACVPH